MKLTLTLAQSMVPSSGSVTFTLNGTASPKLNSCPSRGSSRVTFGAVLPTTICTLALPVRPLGSLAGTVAEVPAVREGVAVGVTGAGGGERHLQRRLTGGHGSGRLCHRGVAVGRVLDAVQGGVLVAAEPGDAVVEDVQRAV